MKEVTWNFCILQWQLSEAYKKNMFVFAIETDRKVSTREKKSRPRFPPQITTALLGCLVTTVGKDGFLSKPAKRELFCILMNFPNFL